MRWTIEPGLCPRGTTRPPGDKSISHRALILAAIADGESRISNLPAGDDVASTARCLRQLGCEVSLAAGHARVQGMGLQGLRAPRRVLDCGNSGTTMRLLAGILAGQPFAATLDGDASLRHRPMERVAEPLRRMGATIETTAGCAPVSIRGGDLSGIEYDTPVPSAQIKSCVLLAGLYAAGATTLREDRPSRDHTERLLQAMGVDIDGIAASGGTTVRPPEGLTPLVGAVPGDISSATFWLVAATLAPQADLTLEYVGVNPGRAAIVELLQSWGADITVTCGPDWYGEPTATLRVRGSAEPLSGGTLRGELTARLIDEVPALVLLGAGTRDGIVVRDGGELRVKESDRIVTIAAALRALGGELVTYDDGLVVPGGQRLRGGVVDAAGDHRIALAAAAVAVGVPGTVEIDGAEVADISYPGFLDEFVALGGSA